MKQEIEDLKKYFSVSELAEIIGVSRQTIYNLMEPKFSIYDSNSKTVKKIDFLYSYYIRLLQEIGDPEAKGIMTLKDNILKDLLIKNKRFTPTNDPMKDIKNALNLIFAEDEGPSKPQKEKWFIVAKLDSGDKRTVIMLKMLLGMQNNIEVVEFDAPEYENYMLQTNNVFPEKLISVGGTQINSVTKMLIDFCKEIESHPFYKGDIRYSKDKKIVLINGNEAEDTYNLAKMYLESIL